MQRTVAVGKRIEQALRTIPAQHRKIRELLDALARSAGRGDATAAASEAAGQLAEALEAHFSLEERFFFPSLQDVHPELAPRFLALCQEHVRILLDVEALRRPRRGADGAAQESVTRLVDAIAEHERREEDLISLAASLPPAD